MVDLRLRLTCPMCGGPVQRSKLADDVLECPEDGPVIYLPKNRRERNLIVAVDYPPPDRARFASVDEALDAAIPHLVRLVEIERQVVDMDDGSLPAA